MMAAYTADDVRKLRDLTGMGMEQCKRAFEMAADPTKEFDGDVIWAACTVDAAGLAIHVKGGPGAREQWNVRHGAAKAEALRERDPSVDVNYPVRRTGSGALLKP